VPAQQGLRGDNHAQCAQVTAGQQQGQRGQHRTVGPRQPRGLDLTPEHGHLVAQDKDLGVLGAIAAAEQREPAE
jgi:hypothetical protein